MKTRILVLLVALTASAAFAIAAETPVADTNDNVSKGACCQSHACATTTGATCSCKKNEECCVTATKPKTGKTKKAAEAGCCQSQACGNNSSVGKDSSGKCSCSKKGGHACKTPAAK